MSAFAQGTHVLRDRFRLVRQLGEGGMGVVWEVEEAATQKHLAIKFIRDDTEKAARRVRREAETTSAIAHPNIVRVFEVAEDDAGAAAIVMELLEGESLGARLSREGALGVGQTCAILRRVVSALRAAHATGVVHRDLKPDNVFLVTGPDGSVDVRVLDFGIAKHVGLPAHSLTVTGEIMGTPMYMSPEQAAGERGLDARTDVWSIAVIAFECLAGVPPVTGDNYGQLLARLIRGQISHLAHIAPGLPADLVAAVDGALVPREQRGFDLAEMEATLARHADAAIDLPRVVVQSDPSLPIAPRSNDSLLETQVVSVVTKPGRRGLAVGVILGVALAVAPAVYLFRVHPWSRPTAAPPTTTQPEAPPSAPAADAPPPAPSAPVTAAASVEAVSSSKPIAPRATHGGSRTPTPSAAVSGPKRLQGGVAGDVPF